MDKEQKSKPSFFAEFWSFVINNKRYWLLPLVIIVLLLAAFILFTESSALTPFIYDIF
jgi:hypothetical protein